LKGRGFPAAPQVAQINLGFKPLRDAARIEAGFPGNCQGRCGGIFQFIP